MFPIYHAYKMGIRSNTRTTLDGLSLYTRDSSKLARGLIIGDALISVTCFVLGMLVIFGTIAMPPAAAYALLATSGLITVLWITNQIKAAVSLFIDK